MGHHALGMSGTAATPNDPAFSLMISLKFRDTDAKEEFVEIIRPVTEYVRRHEPTTLAYEVLFSDREELHALLVERYADKEDAYLRIHKSSQPFLEFRPKLMAMQEEGKVDLSRPPHETNSRIHVGLS